jgi:hypothetical protein
VPPLEVWEKVFLKDAAFLQDTHGQVGCVICHGGNSVATEKDLAHEEVITDPSYTSCESCHQDIMSSDSHSLHNTLEGFRTVLESRGGDLSEGSPLDTALNNHCSACHTTCGQCHISRPAEVDGGFLSGHEIKGTPSMQYNCVACHGSRVGDEYLGLNEGILADVHWKQYGMICTACHGDEVHGGTGDATTMYDNPNSITCEDAGCHEDVWTDTSENPQHAQHLSDIQCQVCHSISYKNCYGCHVSIDEEGIPCRTSEPSVMDFEIGNNPLRSSERPYKYVVLRHVPTCSGTCDYYGVDLFPDFNAVPTWKYTTPHNIQLDTPQNASCEACHGNSEIFLSEDDIRPEELDANQGVIVENPPDIGMLP